MAIATGQITIVDYNDAVSLSGLISSNLARTVIWKSADGTFQPNWGSTPLVLTPSLFVAGGGGSDLMPGSSAVSGPEWWYQFDSGTKTKITSGSDNYVIGAKPWALTVSANKLSSFTAVTYFFKCTYTDPSTSLQLPYETSITFQKAESGIAVLAVASANSTNVFKNGTPASIGLTCNLWKGTTEDTTAGYKWFKDDGTVFGTTLTSAATGTGLYVNSITGFVSGGQVLIGAIAPSGMLTGYDVRTITATPAAGRIVVNTIPSTGNRAIGTTVCVSGYDSWMGNGWRRLFDDSVTTGTSTKSLTVFPDAVLNIATFKCKIIDNTDGTGTYSDGVTVLDYTDPYYVDIISTAGNFFKPGIVEGTTLTAQLKQNGIDANLPAGMDYVWRIRDKDGVSCNFISSGTPTKTGASISVTGADITVKGTITCSVESV